MRLFIPSLGTKLRLTRDWSFELYCESRNKSLWDLAAAVKMDKIPWQARKNNSCQVLLPNRTLLKVDRIFIRQGAVSFDSVTFRFYDLEPYGTGGTYNGRFWVPLADANNMECEVVYG